MPKEPLWKKQERTEALLVARKVPKPENLGPVYPGQQWLFPLPPTYAPWPCVVEKVSPSETVVLVGDAGQTWICSMERLIKEGTAK